MECMIRRHYQYASRHQPQARREDARQKTALYLANATRVRARTRSADQQTVMLYPSHAGARRGHAIADEIMPCREREKHRGSKARLSRERCNMF